LTQLKERQKQKKGHPSKKMGISPAENMEKLAKEMHGEPSKL